MRRLSLAILALAAPAAGTPVCAGDPSDPDVARLDANADELHSDITPAVLALMSRGVPGACAVIDKLEADSATTRLHAQRVVEGVAGMRNGFAFGRGYHDEYGQEAISAALAETAYDSEASPIARRDGARRWRLWLSRQHGAWADFQPSDGPSRSAMQQALDAVRPQLARCGEPVDVTVSFAANGRVTSIYGTASTSRAYRVCLAKATAAIRLAPFKRASVWTQYP
jgi:hypothetical protein